MRGRRSKVVRDRIMVARNLLSIAQAGPAIDAVQSAGIEVVVYKGAALLELGLVPPARPMADVDVLVRHRDHRRAEAILTGSGLFRPAIRTRPATSRAIRPGALCTPEGTQIDLHAALSGHRQWPIDYDSLFASAVELRLGGVTTWRPCNEDLVVTMAIDRAKDGFFTGETNVRDLVAVAAGLDLDWSRVVERARTWRCTTAIWVTLRQASRAGRAPIPAWVIRALAPGRVRRAYLDRILDTAAVPAYRFHHHPLRVRQLVAGPALADDLVSYLAAVGRFTSLRLRDVLEASGR